MSEVQLATVAYVATAALAVSAGLSFGARPTGAARWLGVAAGAIIVGAVTAGGLALGSQAPWVGPMFAIVTGATAVLVAAYTRRDEPGFRSEPFWRRVRMALSIRR
jgi:hypothetical protein